jgi:TonB family protein
MNVKFIAVSLGIHILFWISSLTLTNPKRLSSNLNKQSVEINLRAKNSHFQKVAKNLKVSKNVFIEKKSDHHGSPMEKSASLESGNNQQSLIAQYAGDVSRLVNEQKFYPLLAKKMRQAGEVILRLTLNRNGQIIQLAVERASIFPSLNTASIECLKKISSFPPIPAELKMEQLSFSIPMEYKIL